MSESSTFHARLNASHLLHAAMSAAETDDDRAAVTLLFTLLKREHEDDSAVSKPELAKAIEYLAHDTLEDSMDAGYNIALGCLARNFGIMGDHQWPELSGSGTSEIHRSGTRGRIAVLEAENATLNDTIRAYHATAKAATKRIAKLKAQLKTAQIECDRAEGQADKFAKIIESMAAKAIKASQ